MRKEYDLKNGRPDPYAKRFTPAGKQALIDQFLEFERLAACPPSPKRTRTKS